MRGRIDALQRLTHACILHRPTTSALHSAISPRRSNSLQKRQNHQWEHVPAAVRGVSRLAGMARAGIPIGQQRPAVSERRPLERAMKRTGRYALPYPLALFLVAGWLARGDSPTGSSGHQDHAELFTQYTADSFEHLPKAGQPIDFSSVNEDLLSAAVFHETNRRREQNKLSALRYEPKAQAAAKIQAQAMAAGQFVSHENNLPGKKTLLDRARSVGLKPHLIAENVASCFGLRYKSGTPFYKRHENGQTVASATPDGPPLPRHTYLSFAKALLDEWMHSPEHRKNILQPAAQFLGCSCRLPKENKNSPMVVFYCDQVFFTPFD